MWLCKDNSNWHQADFSPRPEMQQMAHSRESTRDLVDVNVKALDSSKGPLCEELTVIMSFM